jgi:two-component system phosphate regulon response regulator PhoB
MAVSLLVVEDELAIREMLAMLLEQSGYEVRAVSNAEDALSLISKKLPDLLLLDWMLPGMSGIDLAKKLKNDVYSKKMPIVMLTALGEEENKVKGLDIGADDYVTKPFSPRELIARIKAVLRRVSPHKTEELIVVNNLQLDPVTYRVSCEDKPIELGPTEFRLLHFFMTHQERVYTRVQLLDNVWGTNVYVEERTVDVHIRRLRKALEPYGCETLIQTVRGAGYRLSLQ